MQTVTNAFTAEESSSVRHIAESLLVSWKRDYLGANRTFTIGVSTIGGTGVIGANPGAIGSPGNYRYFDETSHLLNLAWERGFNIPTGGVTKGMAEARLDNNSGRFTPRYMGGNSELYTAILPERPFLINAGFDIGAKVMLPQFAGLISEQPLVDQGNRILSLKGEDYIRFFENKFLDHEAMFTSQMTDNIMETLLTGTLGMSTAQFELDAGINKIPFAIFEKGIKMSQIFHQLAEAENGHFYQDELGKFRFENRQHWNSSPYTSVRKVIYTAEVLNQSTPTTDHLINVVEVNVKQRTKQPEESVFSLAQAVRINASGNTELFVSYDNPVLQVTSLNLTVNASEDGSGTDYTTSVQIKNRDDFAQTSKITFYNTSSLTLWLTSLEIRGRTVKTAPDVYIRKQDDSSVTAYNERTLTIDNPYIQNQDWGQSYAQMILDDFSSIENLQSITILAKPELQLGDLISWQGRYWRIFDIKSTLSPEYGFVQELTLLQRTIRTYFRIGISTIGGTDKIAP